MTLRHHEIAEAGHRILNPFTEDKLRLLGDVSGVRAETRILDLACGKGEMLCRWAQWFGASGVGVDLSRVFSAAARERASELGVADRVEIVQGDAAAYEAPLAAFDLVSCLGATWIGGGIAGTLALMLPALKPGGTILVGEPYWIAPPPPDALTAMAMAPDDFTDLAGTAQRIDATGLELVEMVLANQDSWDRYEASQWATVTDWLAANPADPDHAAVRAFRDGNRRTYLRWGRAYLGWGVFVARARITDGPG
jgi:SAM-dependent methyltransferase